MQLVSQNTWLVAYIKRRASDTLNEVVRRKKCNYDLRDRICLSAGKKSWTPCRPLRGLRP